MAETTGNHAAPAADKCHTPAKKAALADAHAPEVSLPLRFITTGVVSLLAGTALIAVRPDILTTYHYNQYVLAATHLIVLGWLASVIMGATYQLVPVALETTLRSPRLAKWHFVLHLIGFPGMAAMFWVWNVKQVGHFGSFVALGAFFHVWNIGRTLRRAPHRNAVRLGIASALTWLTLAIVAGLYVSAAKCWDFTPFNHLSQMHAHAHLGVLGYFMMMLVAVSFRLVPMFTLGVVQSERRARAAIWLLNAGITAVLLTVLIDSKWKPAAALLTTAGFAVYGVELAAMLRARARRKLDAGLKMFLLGVTLLAPASAVGLVLSWPGLPLTELTGQLENVYGILALFGVLSCALLGMLHKIVPFLVWYAAYGPQIGRGKLPALSELYSAPLQRLGYGFYLLGFAGTTGGALLQNAVVVRWSCAVMAAGVAMFVGNLALIFRHLRRPGGAR